MLFHISEQFGITRFEPRPTPDGKGIAVWAVHHDKLQNYLLPRDCPRVIFYAGQRTTESDRNRFLGQSSVVVAVERIWLDRIRSAKLYCYQMPEENFRCVDRNAGYFQSSECVAPVAVEVIDDCLAALASREIEIRVLPSLWDLHDAVVASTLSYSMIRMRNAAPRIS